MTRSWVVDPSWRGFRPVLLSTALVLSLGACKPEGGDSFGSIPEGAGVDVVNGTGGADGVSLALPSLVDDRALAALGAYFVTSFQAFEAAAEQLRSSDPRYLLQKNRWRFSDAGGSFDSYPLASARIEYAHAAGLTGAGQVVSVVDSGFLVSHETFAGKQLSFPLGLPVDAHGTGVASVLAGDSGRMVGVAPGANLALGSFETAATRTAATREAIRLNAVAQNNSWGYEIDLSRASFDAAFSGSSGYFEALSDYAAQGVVVFAVSNRSTRSRSALMEALPALRPELEPGWLAVANAVPSFNADRIVSARLLSSGCLDAARWCLVADGGWVAAQAGGTGAYGFATGSSFAAPQVAGALALLGEAFPDLTPHQLRLRLLASADNRFFAHDGTLELAPGFFHGYSREFGHGFLDMRAALLPIGTPRMPAESGGSVVAGEPTVLAGAATGDAVVRALAERAVLVVDGLGADFRMGAEALVARRGPAPLVSPRLAMHATAQPPSDSRFARDSADMIEGLPVTRVSLEQPGDTLGVELLLPAVEGRPGAYGLGLRGRLDLPAASLQIGARLLRDATGATGLSGLDGQVVRGEGTLSAMVDIEAHANLAPSTSITAFAQMGLSEGGDGGAAVETSTTRFSSIGVDLRHANAFRSGDRLSIGVSMPTAVDAGSASFTLPVARSAGGVVFSPVSVDMSPADREVRLSAGYAMPLSGGWMFVAEGIHAVNRGHVRGEVDTGAIIGMSIRF